MARLFIVMTDISWIIFWVYNMCSGIGKPYPVPPGIHTLEIAVIGIFMQIIPILLGMATIWLFFSKEIHQIRRYDRHDTHN